MGNIFLFMDIETNRAVGAALRELRRQANFTQAEVARRLGKPQSYVSKIESGERYLRVYELGDYAAALNSSPDEIAGHIFG